MLLTISNCLISSVLENNELNDLRTFFKSTFQKYKVKSLQDFLEEKGLLLNLDDPNSNLTDAQKEHLRNRIARAKAEHRKLYLKEKRKEYNEKQARVELRLNKVGRGNEYDKFKKRAKGKHLATFIKSCALAYLKNEYVVPNEEVLNDLIKEISRYREDRNKEGRNVKFILDKVRKQRMAYSRDVSDLQEKMYALNNLDFTFDLEQLIVNAIQHPEEHFLEYAERHIRKMPEAIEDLERLISKVKTEMDDNKE
jgi:hypothetical protein